MSITGLGDGVATSLSDAETYVLRSDFNDGRLLTRVAKLCNEGEGSLRDGVSTGSGTRAGE